MLVAPAAKCLLSLCDHLQGGDYYTIGQDTHTHGMGWDGMGWDGIHVIMNIRRRWRGRKKKAERGARWSGRRWLWIITRQIFISSRCADRSSRPGRERRKLLYNPICSLQVFFVIIFFFSISSPSLLLLLPCCPRRRRRSFAYPTGTQELLRACRDSIRIPR